MRRRRRVNPTKIRRARQKPTRDLEHREPPNDSGKTEGNEEERR